MTEPLLLGVGLGLFAGAIPGPFSALVAATSLDSGFWAGFRVAAVPLVSEIIVLSAAAVLVSQLPDAVLRWMGVGGGILILYLARRTWMRAERNLEARVPDGGPGRSVEAAVLALVSPTPWAFWMFVGAPLFVGYWRERWPTAAMFAGGFIVMLLTMRTTVAGVASYGHRRLRPAWRRRAMKGASAVLVVAGLVLGWQSWVGNFERMVTDVEGIRSVVTDSASDGP